LKDQSYAGQRSSSVERFGLWAHESKTEEPTKFKYGI